MAAKIRHEDIIMRHEQNIIVISAAKRHSLEWHQRAGEISASITIASSNSISKHGHQAGVPEMAEKASKTEEASNLGRA